MATLTLPSCEYKITFTDQTVTLISVHQDETLESVVREFLEASGTEAHEMEEVEFYRTFDLVDEMSDFEDPT
jgi:hypothetical protein